MSRIRGETSPEVGEPKSTGGNQIADILEETIHRGIMTNIEPDDTSVPDDMGLRDDASLTRDVGIKRRAMWRSPAAIGAAGVALGLVLGIGVTSIVGAVKAENVEPKSWRQRMRPPPPNWPRRL